MDEMDIVRKITHLVYTHRRDAAFTGQKQPNVKHRDIMMLDAIIKMGDLVKMSDISAYFQITPAAVSQCIKNFEKTGWVERTVLESDRRSVYVRVSDEAKQMVQEMEEHMKQQLIAFIAELGEDDAEAFVRILEKGFTFFKCERKKEEGKETGKC